MTDLLVKAQVAGAWLRGESEPSVAAALGHDLAWAEAVVASSACRMVLTVASPEVTMIHRLWLRPDGVLGVLSAPDDQAELRVGGAQFTPDLLADLVGLRVRPHLEGPLVDVSEVDLPAQLLAGTPQERGAAVASVSRAARGVWPGLADALDGGRWQVWSVMSTYATGEGEYLDVLTVLDSPAGVLVLETAEDGWALKPTTPTELWLRLIELLPDDEGLIIPPNSGG